MEARIQGAKTVMKCPMCGDGELRPGHTTVMFSRSETIFVVKGVPVEICSQCGDYVIGETAADWISDQAESAVARGAEVEILRYAA
jgi:YgiT-type zinc finger domain-containing protein